MIDTVALRIKTLKQAMSGKLSEQKSEDGEAIPEGIVVSDSSADENAYAIPTSWRWVRVKDVVAKDVGGGTPSKAVPEYWNNGEISWATVKDFSNSENGYINETIDHITQEGLENSSANMVDEEAIVVCMRMALGKIVRVAKPMAINQDLRALWLKSFVEQDYFVYFYKTLKVEGRGTTVAGIKKDELMNYAFPVPPVKEQRRIIEKVNSIFEQLDIIDDLQLQYASDLEALKSKIIDAGIQGKLTKQLPQDGTAEELLKQIVDCQNNMIKASKFKKPKDIKNIDIEDIPFEIPNTWKWEKWGNIINVVSARRVHQSDWRKEGIPFYRAREIAKLAVDGSVENDLFISQELYDEFSRDRVPQPGDLMVSAVGTLGKSYVVKDDDLFYYKDASVLCFENYGGMNPYYLRYVMQSSLMKNQIESNSGGTTVDTLTMVRMVQYILPIPPLNEQDRIVSKINEILEIL